MAVYFQNVQNINITGRISKSEYQYTLQSSDTQLLYDIAPKLRDKIAEIDGLRDVTTDLYIKNPQMTVEWTAKRRPSTASPSTRSARSCSTPSAHAKWRPSTRRPTIIRSFSRANHGFRPTPRSCRTSS
jgi:hypothetical protein